MIAAAGLDVLEQEPPGGNNPLLRMDNVILTAHVASATARFDPARRRRVGLELSLALTGKWPMSCVNPRGAGGERPQALAAGVDGARAEFLGNGPHPPIAFASGFRRAPSPCLRGEGWGEGLARMGEAMVTRRSLMLTGAAVTAQFSMGARLMNAAAAEPVRYPDPAIRILDPRFEPHRSAVRRSSGSPPVCVFDRRAGVVRRPAMPVVERHR